MSDSASYNDVIYTGVWTDHSFGRIEGSTLTLSRESGGLLIAFLALFVGAAGRSFWRITRYALHLAFSTESNTDGAYHQRQAILRNSHLALDAGLNLIVARLAWRNRNKHLDRKLSSIALIAFLVSAVFVTAGIFSSKVTGGTGSPVLLTGSHCGNMTEVWQNDTASQALAGTDYNAAMTQRASQYLAYAYRCYQNQTAQIPPECKVFVWPALPYQKNTSASCPFDSEMCVLPQGNLFLDSGYLDRYKYLGLNRGPRFSFRLHRHCAPIKTLGHSELITNGSDASNSWMQYYYGSSYDGLNWRNYTHKIRSKPWTDPTDWEQLKTGDGYKISAPSQFDPISQLNKTDSVVSLLFLESADVKNYAKVEDPWFSATAPKELPTWTMLELPNNSYFVADEPAKVLGCASKMQFCNPSLPSDKQCWDRSAQNASWLNMWPDPADQKIMNGYVEYFQSLYAGTIQTPQGYYVIQGLPALQTQFTLNGVIQPAIIPPNRWQIEMEYIFQTDLAASQARVVELGSGSQSGPKEYNTDCGLTKECHRLCKNQKIRTPGYYSFSMLGICIILIVGSIIIFVGTFLETIVDFVATLPMFARSRKFAYARLEWQSNSTLELQRHAHESLGMGTWSSTFFSVPVTEHGERLAALDISDASHPRLVADRELRADSTAYSRSEIAKPQPQETVAQVNDQAEYERVPFKE